MQKNGLVFLFFCHPSEIFLSRKISILKQQSLFSVWLKCDEKTLWLKIKVKVKDQRQTEYHENFIVPIVVRIGTFICLFGFLLSSFFIFRIWHVCFLLLVQLCFIPCSIWSVVNLPCLFSCSLSSAAFVKYESFAWMQFWIKETNKLYA